MSLERRLSPFPTSQRRGERLATRARSPNPERITPPSLRPQAAPIDAYARPEAPQEDPSGLLSAARTLGQVAPGLLSTVEAFVNKAERDKERIDPDSQAAAEAFLMQHSPEEIERLRSQGQAGPLNNLAGQVAYGKYRAHRMYESVQQDIASGNIPIDESLNDVIRERTQSEVARGGNDRGFLRGFTDTAQPYYDRISRTNAREMGQAELQRRYDVTYQNWYDDLNNDLVDGATPQEIAAHIFGSFDRNKNYLGIPFKDQQKMALQLAAQKASEGDTATAEAILTHERDNGPVKGQSLLSSQETSQSAQRILQGIEGEHIRTANAEAALASEDAAVQNAYDRMQQGLPVKDAVVLSENGGTKTLSSDALTKRGLARFHDDLATDPFYQSMTPETRKRTALALYAGSGVLPGELVDTMAEGASILNSGNVSGGDVPPKILAGVETYRDLMAVAPQLVEKELGSQAVETYELLEAVLQSGEFRRTGIGNNGVPLDALQRVAYATRPEAIEDSKFRWRDLERAAQESANKVADRWLFNLFGPRAPANTNYIQRELERNAKLIVRLGTGISNEEALEHSKKIFERGHAVYNGHTIRRSSHLPSDYEARFDEVVENYISNHGSREGYDAEDIAISHDPRGGAFVLIERDTGLPVSTNRGIVQFTKRELDELREARRAAVEAGVERNSQRRNQPREARPHPNPPREIPGVSLIGPESSRILPQ